VAVETLNDGKQQRLEVLRRHKLVPVPHVVMARVSGQRMSVKVVSAGKHDREANGDEKRERCRGEMWWIEQTYIDPGDSDDGGGFGGGVWMSLMLVQTRMCVILDCAVSSPWDWHVHFLVDKVSSGCFVSLGLTRPVPGRGLNGSHDDLGIDLGSSRKRGALVQSSSLAQQCDTVAQGTAWHAARLVGFFACVNIAREKGRTKGVGVDAVSCVRIVVG
jgi:hypothetical protein